MKMNTPVGDVLFNKGRGFTTVSADATVCSAAKIMDEKTIGSLLILDEAGKIAGIVTERDCFRKVVLAGKSSKDLKVSSIMTTKVIYVAPHNTVDECMTLMTEKRFRHLPVIDDENRILGVISSGDLVKHVTNQDKFIIQNLENYIQGSL